MTQHDMGKVTRNSVFANSDCGFFSLVGRELKLLLWDLLFFFFYVVFYSLSLVDVISFAVSVS